MKFHGISSDFCTVFDGDHEPISVCELKFHGMSSNFCTVFDGVVGLHWVGTGTVLKWSERY